MSEPRHNPLDDAERQLAWSRRYLKREKFRHRVFTVIIVLAVLALSGGICVGALAAAGVLPLAPASSAQSETPAAADTSLPESPASHTQSDPAPETAKPNEFTVSFDARGGAGEYPDEAVLFGTLLAPPQDPVREGYRFAGWYRDAAGTDAWDFALDSVQADMTLYAKWADDAAPDSALPQTGIETHAVFWCCVFAAALILVFAAAGLLLHSYRRQH